VNLIITSASRLREVYGAYDARRILGAIGRLVEAHAARDVQSRVLLIEEGDAELGVAGAQLEPEAIARQIWSLALALGSASGRDHARLSSVLVVGGPDIVPFYEAPNPATHDGDETVAGDWIYGARDPFGPMSWPVGRLPGAAGGDPDLLLRLLEFAASARPIRTAQRKTFGYCTAVWRHAAEQVYATIASPERLLVSPPLLATTLDRRLLDGAGLVYCNLHGVRDGPPWYGQSEEHPALVAALRPADLAGLDLRGALVVSEACYGASIAGRDEGTSLALAFLARGAAGFVGATAVSYGPPEPPPGEADLIALHFLQAVVGSGGAGSAPITLGDAFAAARAGMLRDTLAGQRMLDEDDQKTLLEFVLYGDPTIVIH
jgi:hypothetical protein